MTIVNLGPAAMLAQTFWEAPPAASDRPVQLEPWVDRSTVKVDSAVDRVDSRQQVDSNSGIALSTTVNHCQPKVDSKHVCPLSTTVDSGRQWSTGSTGLAGSTGSTGRQRERVDREST